MFGRAQNKLAPIATLISPSLTILILPNYFSNYLAKSKISLLLILLI